MALSLSGSNRSLSLASLGQGGAFIVVQKLLCLISSRSTTSTPNNNLNGVNFVAMETVVLSLHIALGITSAHLAFFLHSRIFLIASNINVLALSTAPLDCGW
jgi:hypothetical protein